MPNTGAMECAVLRESSGACHIRNELHGLQEIHIPILSVPVCSRLEKWRFEALKAGCQTRGPWCARCGKNIGVEVI